MDGVRIDECGADEIPAVLALWGDIADGVSLSVADSLAEVADMRERTPELFLVAREGERIVAAVMAGRDGRRAYIYHLGVRPEHRRRGIGGALVEELERRLRRLGARRVKCQVYEDKGAALAFWRSRGYEVEEDLVPLGKYLR